MYSTHGHALAVVGTEADETFAQQLEKEEVEDGDTPLLHNEVEPNIHFAAAADTTPCSKQDQDQERSAVSEALQAVFATDYYSYYTLGDSFDAMNIVYVLSTRKVVLGCATCTRPNSWSKYEGRQYFGGISDF